MTERDVIFIGDRNIRLQYNTISVHAISKDVSNFPNRHCIFMLVNEQDVEHVDEPDVRLVSFFFIDSISKKEVS